MTKGYTEIQTVRTNTDVTETDWLNQRVTATVLAIVDNDLGVHWNTNGEN